ncbi:carbohydrate-binding protein [Amycolatopsis sp. Hca4]|uniref:carbohydrate-binding protein n=1 Tax=Amycolatopsis sp. Hca4 TaxID=2742131 RepID=UPI001590F088|nr:carbohydrate-binding protein [Amycolatopsis sp. Hca4]QKV73319.1 glycosyl hydrolase [Amycolatopsis sp. Hca4]
MSIRTTTAALTSIATAAATAVVLSTGADASPAAAAAGCGVLFDDFHYASPTDSAFGSAGWTTRNDVGSPGVPGARWLTGNISFPAVGGERVAQLTATTDGSAAGTTHAELYQNQLRFFEGTYASRVRFTDAPDSGPDGDHVNETYFTISPLRYDRDPLYSELDFSEYLPNGGWGGPQADYQTSWYTYWNNPSWDGLRTSTAQNRSFAGWHDVVTQVSGGHVKYYIDGVLTADHTTDAQGNPVYPRTPMSINYNMWFIDTAGHTSGNSVYTEQVDWTYYAGNQVVSPADAVAQAGQYRSAGTSHVDTVTGCTTPTTPPPTTATTKPTTPTTPTTPTQPANCSAAPEWDWGTVYLEGRRVKHNAHLWQANWWTQGSEPGLTAQWRDLGPC